jgi:hypothetical protein
VIERAFANMFLFPAIPIRRADGDPELDLTIEAVEPGNFAQSAIVPKVGTTTRPF